MNRWRATLALGAAWLGPLLAGAAAPPTGPLLDFAPDEVAQILRHGPWPPPLPRDPGNALAGRAAAIALGQALFFDARLSPDGRLACASCHQPAQAFSDGRARAEGRAPLARNTPSLWNAAHQRWLGWDGAFDSLWSQALHPLRSPLEMAASAPQLQALLQGDAALACRWRAATGGPPPGPPASTEAADALLVTLAQALGAYVGTLVSDRTPFDRFRDALARSDRPAAARYPVDAQRGLRLFVGRGQCSTCHSGPLFSNGEFADIGARFFVAPGVVDPGRHGGIAALQASPYTLLGRWAQPTPPDEAARKTRHVLAQHRNFGEFKVPSLRNVALTAPYLHDGQLATLDEVLRHYADLNLDRLHADGEQILKPLRLSAGEQADLRAFLHSLSDDGARRWQAQSPRRGAGRC